MEIRSANGCSNKNASKLFAHFRAAVQQNAGSKKTIKVVIGIKLAISQNSLTMAIDRPWFAGLW